MIIYAEQIICAGNGSGGSFSAGSDPGRGYAALSLVVWTLKREVRAFGGCLGMHRR
jgi:hypothetical protein